MFNDVLRFEGELDKAADPDRQYWRWEDESAVHSTDGTWHFENKAAANAARGGIYVAVRRKPIPETPIVTSTPAPTPTPTPAPAGFQWPLGTVALGGYNIPIVLIIVAALGGWYVLSD
jgi:hypothetical protein